MRTILKIENISKQYRLGLVSTGTLSHDINRFWHRIRGKEDPYLKVGAVNDRSAKASEDYVWALRDIDFDVKDGEVLGIIGKNGAGKSTLLKILSKVTSPTTGVIKSRGRIASLLEVGTGFHPELTGKENIYLNGAILGMTKSEIKNKIDEIVAFSGCEMFIDTPVKRYSSGMRVRLAFAVAAHLEPDILVVDEVLAVGDAEFQKKAIGKMQDISKGDGRTVLFVSHNMVAVQQLCTRCIVLTDGKMTYNGDVQGGINTYLSHRDSGIGKELNFPISIEGGLLEKVSLTNTRNDEVSTLILGADYSFGINLKNSSKKEIDFNVRIQLFDENETLITTYSAYHTNDTIKTGADERVLMKCQIERLSIIPGNYVIGIRVVNIYEKSVLYQNDQFRPILIENGDYYNSGKIPNTQNIGKVLSNYTWTSVKISE